MIHEPDLVKRLRVGAGIAAPEWWRLVEEAADEIERLELARNIDKTMAVPELTLEEYEKLLPLLEVDGIKYYVPNTHCAWRVESIKQKEPDTLEWIDGMKEDAKFML